LAWGHPFTIHCARLLLDWLSAYLLLGSQTLSLLLLSLAFNFKVQVMVFCLQQ
jgi:hypothetical protein